MARKRSGWQQRRPPGDGPRLLDGEVPEGRSAGGGVLESFSWRLALVLIGLGLLTALLAQLRC